MRVKPPRARYALVRNGTSGKFHITMELDRTSFCGVLYVHDEHDYIEGTEQALATVIVTDLVCQRCRASLEAGTSPAGMTIGTE